MMMSMLTFSRLRIAPMSLSIRALAFVTALALLGENAHVSTVHAQDVTVTSATDAGPQPEPAEAASEAEATAPAPGIWPTLAAIGPGFFVHGAGAFVARDRLAAKRLLIAGTTGFLLFLGGGSAVALSGASRRLMAPILPLVAMGGGVFFVSWFADIYAASTGGRDVGAARWIAPVGVELGYRYVYDPQFAYRNFSYASIDLRADRLRVTPSTWLALDEANQRLRIDAAYRFEGRTPRRQSRDGSYFDLAHALTWHRYPNEAFSVWTFEGRLEGRLDLARWGKSLSGSFAEGHVGAGLELYDFATPGAHVGNDASGLLLARFGFGVYFGDDADRTGEAQLYYDHRHDDYAGGLGVTGIGGGFLGHFGLSGHYYLSRSWGLSLLGEVGSAYIASASVLYRLAKEGV
jgi:hypothetical protein